MRASYGESFGVLSSWQTLFGINNRLTLLHIGHSERITNKFFNNKVFRFGYSKRDLLIAGIQHMKNLSNVFWISTFEVILPFFGSAKIQNRFNKLHAE